MRLRRVPTLPRCCASGGWPETVRQLKGVSDPLDVSMRTSTECHWLLAHQCHGFVIANPLPSGPSDLQGRSPMKKDYQTKPCESMTETAGCHW